MGVPVGADGLDIASLERALRERPRFVVATSNFQNPTGATLLSGVPFTFSVTANGTSPLSYQWEKSTDNVSYSPIA